MTLDGTNTKFYRPASGPIFRVTYGYATFEGIAFEGANRFDDIAVDGGTGTSVRIVDSAVDRMAVQTSGGALEVRATAFREGQIVCSGGTVTLSESDWWRSNIRATNCQASISRTRFEGAADQTLGISGGVLRVLNNVFLVSSEFADLAYVSAVASGSIFAFNTIVNSSSVTMSPVALYCDLPTLRVSSNIIAYNSTNPISGCAVTNSLFDLPAGSDAAGNTSADASTFFLDLAGGDYRLSMGSPAIGIAEPGIVTDDIAGRPRPSPVGSQPDAGAHEAP